LEEDPKKINPSFLVNFYQLLLCVSCVEICVPMRIHSN